MLNCENREWLQNGLAHWRRVLTNLQANHPRAKNQITHAQAQIKQFDQWIEQIEEACT